MEGEEQGARGGARRAPGFPSSAHGVLPGPPTMTGGHQPPQSGTEAQKGRGGGGACLHKLLTVGTPACQSGMGRCRAPVPSLGTSTRASHLWQAPTRAGHAPHRSPPAHLVNREVGDIDGGVGGTHRLGDLHAARQGLPGLVCLHPPLAALQEAAGWVRPGPVGSEPAWGHFLGGPRWRGDTGRP